MGSTITIAEKNEVDSFFWEGSISAINPLFPDSLKCFNLILIYWTSMHNFSRKSSIPNAWICGVVRGSCQKDYLDTFCQLKCSSGHFILALDDWNLFVTCLPLPVGRGWWLKFNFFQSVLSAFFSASFSSLFTLCPFSVPSFSVFFPSFRLVEG